MADAPPSAQNAPPKQDPAPRKTQPARQPTDVVLRYVGKDGAHTVWGAHPLPAADLTRQQLPYFGLTTQAARRTIIETGLYADATGPDSDEE